MGRLGSHDATRTLIFHRSGARVPVGDYGFDAAHKLARADWLSRVERECAASALLVQASTARRRVGVRPRVIAAVRSALGILLIRAGQRLQGNAAPHSVAADTPADGLVR